MLIARAGYGRAIPAAALAGACAVAAVTPVGDDDGATLCPYRLSTGGWCPGCGCTRAVRALAHADVRSAFAFNPWAILIFAQVAVVAGWVAISPDRALGWWHRNLTRVLAANVAVALAIWSTRMAVGAIPTPW